MNKHSNWGGLLALAGAMILACAGTAYLVVRLAAPAPRSETDPASHRWLHDELGLDADEMQRLDALEAHYQRERERLEVEFDQAKRKLMSILQSSDSYSQDVTETVHEIHAVHGALQDLAIRHYFDMVAALPPAKQERLRQLAVAALSEPQ